MGCMSMHYRRLGHTGLYVSPACIGTMTFGNVTGEAEAARMLGLCAERGINFIDTANGDNGPEGLVGRLVSGHRHDFVIATKVFNPTGPGPNDVGLSRKHIIQACEDSLRRLRTDYIDLYQAHTDDPITPLEETLSALDLLVRQGKVRYVGASNYCAWRLNEALWISNTRNLSGYASIQCLYNLAERDTENEVLPLCRAKGVGVLAWSPLAGGWLTGKYRHSATQSRRLDSGEPMGTSSREHRERVLDCLLAVGNELDASAAVVGLRWVIEQEGVTSAIIGARNFAQLEQNLGCLDLAWTARVRDVLDDASRRPSTYPAVVAPIARQIRDHFNTHPNPGESLPSAGSATDRTN
jgi:1-deoxyxylulose-5-phosphate synthase